LFFTFLFYFQLRNELLQLQQLLEVPQYVMNANGTYVPINQMQNNLMMNPYAMNQAYNSGASSSGMSRAVSVFEKIEYSLVVDP
jgi:hypothetical protein